MRRISYLIFILLIYSCKSIILDLISPNKVDKTLKIMKNESSTIVFLPMIHIAKEKFFHDSKKIIDSLKKENYTIFYEGIQVPSSLTLTDSLKLRKIVGINILSNYQSEKNKSLPKYWKKEKYIAQTNKLLGIDTSDVNVDISVKQLITAHEIKKGDIKLTDCDYSTNLFDKYKCKKVNGYYAINIYRDSIVTKKILDYNKNKSLIIFGKSHWHGMWPYFRDAGYTLVKK